MTTPVSQAPVFYALAQIKFNRIEQMASFVGPLQDALRRQGYPDFREDHQLHMQVTPGPQVDVQRQEVKRWVFTDQERQEGFILLKDALIFQTARYSRFTDFKDTVLKGLGALHGEVELAYVDRIGLRYLDAVIPSEAYPLERLLSPGLIGLCRGVAGQPRHTVTETVSAIGGGTLVVRTLISPQGVVLPPDLQPMSLNLDARIPASQGQETAVLDSDYFVERRETFDSQSVERQLDISHDVIIEAFERATTEQARTQLWQL
ncbi:TIGR04255 family protein [Halomonas sp. LBP4]|uniref:TIGR04255 family protein n=1 Tax=Halomonas sp. LBP4 TaxID=2044917 RepID=UPI0015E8976F|nr:TIGR04255 family protein [Halomonas sp. LBP4]